MSAAGPVPAAPSPLDVSHILRRIELLATDPGCSRYDILRAMRDIAALARDAQQIIEHDAEREAEQQRVTA